VARTPRLSPRFLARRTALGIVKHSLESRAIAATIVALCASQTGAVSEGANGDHSRPFAPAQHQLSQQDLEAAIASVTRRSRAHSADASCPPPIERVPNDAKPTTCPPPAAEPSPAPLTNCATSLLTNQESGEKMPIQLSAPVAGA
jgi:hypothetical protein